MRKTLRRDVAPKGGLEEILTDKLVMLVWRWRLRYETAAIREQADAATHRWESQRAALAGVRQAASLDGLSTAELLEYEVELRNDVNVLRKRDPSALRPELWPKALAAAEEEFGVAVGQMLGVGGSWREHARPDEADVKRVVLEACGKAGVPEAEFWRRLRERTGWELQACHETLERRELTLDRVQLRASMPRNDEWERVLRYEAHLSREFSRTLHALERRQGIRLGMEVSLPVAVDIVGG